MNNNTFTEEKSAYQKSQYHRNAETTLLRVSDTGTKELQIRIQNVPKQLYPKHIATERLNCLISKSKALINTNTIISARPTFFLFIFNTSKTNVPTLSVFIETINKFCDNIARSKINQRRNKRRNCSRTNANSCFPHRIIFPQQLIHDCIKRIGQNISNFIYQIIKCFFSPRKNLSTP